MEDGSQLVAHFCEDLDPAALKKTVEDLVEDALGSASGARTSVSVARGASTVVYLTFVSFREVDQAAVDQMVGKLHRMGAKLTYLSGKEGRSGVLQLQDDGRPLPYSCFETVMIHTMFGQRASIARSLSRTTAWNTIRVKGPSQCFVLMAGQMLSWLRHERTKTKFCADGRSNAVMALAVVAAIPETCRAGDFIH